MDQPAVARRLAKGREVPGPAPVGRPQAHPVQQVEPLGHASGSVLLDLFHVRDQADPGAQTREAVEMGPDDPVSEIRRHEAGPVQGQDRQLRQEIGRDHEVDVRAAAQGGQRIGPIGSEGEVRGDEPDVGMSPRPKAGRPEMDGIHEVDAREARREVRERDILEEARSEHHGDAPLRKPVAGIQDRSPRLRRDGGPRRCGSGAPGTSAGRSRAGGPSGDGRRARA
ncbi:hypothetical protein ASG51_11670 [Methylobacterium sp. Leaf465]|nr:hypothetical protein ASG51_11670 [Methylobacterium sp. Leaf465]